MRRTITLLTVALLSTGCIVDTSTTSTTTVAPTPARRDVVTTLYFGLGVGDAGDLVPPGAWEQFVSVDVANALPAGFTVIESTGRWKDKDSVVREPSRMLIVIHDGSDATSKKLDLLRETYKNRFKQESVLRVDTPADRVSF
jgi:hypothetical protein